MKNFILILSLCVFFACNDSVNDELELKSQESILSGSASLEDYYAAGYHIGTADADWVVDVSFIHAECPSLDFEIGQETIELPAGESITMTVVNRPSDSGVCVLYSNATQLGFDNFVSGYIDLLEERVNSTILNDRAFHEGVLTGFKNRLCGHSITMPFWFVNCDEVDLPGSTNVLGGPSGDGPQLCTSCES